MHSCWFAFFSLIAWTSDVLGVPTDSTPPSIDLITPGERAVYTTVQTVTVRADAQDNVGVVRVDFYDNGALRGSVTTPPYMIPWTVNMAENGPHSWIVRAYDAAGNVGRSGALATVAIDTVLVGWSDTGMQETDGAVPSVYSLLPAYSTVYAQLIQGGKLVKDPGGVTLTYEAVADATGSINTTSQYKGSVLEYAQALYGLSVPVDQGLAGFGMPGQTNQPQRMGFDPAQNWFYAEGIPLTPYDNQGRTNCFPLMHLVARNRSGAVLASTDVVLPVTDQMNCLACHASGSNSDARPPSGWAWECDPVKDYKLNILRYHDDIRSGSSSYRDALIQVRYNRLGLVATVNDGTVVLCVQCHASNLLPGSGASGMRPLTRLIHTKHAKVLDPARGIPLDDAALESGACFQCHAGPESRYLRGAHRSAVNPAGTLAMPCQNCHGNLTDVGLKGRSGWLDEPNCQSCHTGTATHNNGQLFYTNSFLATGERRQAVDRTFSTETNSTAASARLFRVSTDHGGLHCAACHGPAHGEWPSLVENENVQSRQLQGHIGTLAQCEACHLTVPDGVSGGPHGLHPIGEKWNVQHQSLGTGLDQCQDCHGNRGTALALMQSDDRLTLGKNRGQQLFWRGSRIGCFNCHPGPSGQSQGGFQNNPPAVTDLARGTSAESFLDIPLTATDPDGDSLLLRIVSQPTNGIVILNGSLATYFPAGVGPDAFTYAAWDGSTDSNLGTVTLSVNQSDCRLTGSAAVPAAALPGVPVSFRANPSLGHCVGNFSFEWDFGDGTPHSFKGNACHIYAAARTYGWKLSVEAKNLPSWTTNGMITIDPELGPEVKLAVTESNGVLTVAWPADDIPTALETSPDPTQPDLWQPVDGTPRRDSKTWTFSAPMLLEPQFFRVRRVP